MIGQVYGRLTVKGFAGIRNGKRLWNCLCACGNEHQAVTGDLRGGHVKSCGCLRRELAPNNRTRHGHAKGGRVTPTFRAWAAAIDRCTNPRHPAFANYGGRGITVCQQWLDSFEGFLTNMGECPAGESLERIDNEKGYELGNCRWATRVEQGRNRRTNRAITFRGETRLLVEWSAITGFSKQVIAWRLKNGWPVDLALTTPVR